MSHIIRHTFVFGAVAGALAIAACGSDDPEPQGGGGDDSGNGGTAETMSTGSGASTGTGTSAECGPAGVNQDDPCEVCIATSCTQQALACCQQPGCLDVVRCAAEKGCGGIDCYAPDKCQAEIDAAGLDVAQNYAAPLGECALASCAEACGQTGGGGAGGGM